MPLPLLADLNQAHFLLRSVVNGDRLGRPGGKAQALSFTANPCPDLDASWGPGIDTRCTLSPHPGPPIRMCNCWPVWPVLTILSTHQPCWVARAGTGPFKRQQGIARMSATYVACLLTRGWQQGFTKPTSQTQVELQKCAWHILVCMTHFSYRYSLHVRLRVWVTVLAPAVSVV